jgi:fatty acid/phospholipid biosynthesis enzyme
MRARKALVTVDPSQEGQAVFFLNTTATEARAPVSFVNLSIFWLFFASRVLTRVNPKIGEKSTNR